MNSRTMIALGAAAALSMLPWADQAQAGKHQGDDEQHGLRARDGSGAHHDEQHASKAHGWLGVRLQPIEGGLAEALDLKADSGVLISQVLEDSPAAEAGLQSGDIVLRAGDEKTGTPAELQAVIARQSAGDEIDIRFLRDGREKDVRVKLAKMKVEDDFVRQHVRGARRFLDGAHRELWAGTERGFLGVVSQDLDGDLGTYFGATEGGALVTEVVKDSPAAKLGLRAGDVVVEVAGEAIGGTDELRRVVGGYDEATEVEVVWVRDKKKQSGRVELELRETPGLLRPGAVHIPALRMERRERRAAPEEQISEMRRELDELRRELDEMKSEND